MNLNVHTDDTLMGRRFFTLMTSVCFSSQAWENHLRRNRSIVVDLFHGQLRSQVKCKTCGHISARFDPFNFLSLPLPMDSSMHLEITGEAKQRENINTLKSISRYVSLT